MPQRVERFEETPNPHALKCVLASPVGGDAADAARSQPFRDAAAATNHPVASRLFAIPGVTGVLIGPGGAWLTINKAPDAAWKTIKPGVERALGEAV